MIKRRLTAFRFAFRGLALTFSEQVNFRIHIIISILVILSGVWVQLSSIEWCILLICIGSVMAAELFNSSIEQHVNATHPQWNDAAGKTKDIAAAAVLIVSIFAAMIGLIIFIPRILERLN